MQALDNPKLERLNSSKGVGEPPLCLAASVLIAIKRAITCARAETPELAGTHFTLDSPATPEKARAYAELLAEEAAPSYHGRHALYAGLARDAGEGGGALPR